jgi:hypothetical protein
LSTPWISTLFPGVLAVDLVVSGHHRAGLSALDRNLECQQVGFAVRGGPVVISDSSLCSRKPADGIYPVQYVVQALQLPPTARKRCWAFQIPGNKMVQEALSQI